MDDLTTRVRIAENVMIHGGRLGHIVETNLLPPVSGWILVKMDGDLARGQWFPPSHVEEFVS